MILAILVILAVLIALRPDVTLTLLVLPVTTVVVCLTVIIRGVLLFLVGWSLMIYIALNNIWGKYVRRNKPERPDRDQET